MGMLPQTRCGAFWVEDNAFHLQSKYLYPNGFLRILLLIFQFLFWAPHGFAIGFGERLGSSRLVWLFVVSHLEPGKAKGKCYVKDGLSRESSRGKWLRKGPRS